MISSGKCNNFGFEILFVFKRYNFKMKKSVILYLFFLNFTAYAQLSGFYVKPSLTDPKIITFDNQKHYVAVNTSVPQKNKLLIILGGSYSKPSSYNYFSDFAANEGFHVVNLYYPNDVGINPTCGPDPDLTCTDLLREEVIFGTPVSANVNVDSVECLYNRLVKLLEYLVINNPTQGWSQYLSAGIPVWNKILTSGHSQGSGHAAYLAKLYPVDRCLMFSGLNDFSTYYSPTQASNWVSNMSSVSPVSCFFGLLHLQDEVGFADQFIAYQALGMFANDDTTLVDGFVSPYNNSHCLYTNLIPHPFINITPHHNSTLVDSYVPFDTITNTNLLAPVWKYMLETPLITAISKNNMTYGNETKIYPNPCVNFLNIDNLSVQSQQRSIKIYDVLGKEIVFESTFFENGSLQINTSGWNDGVYFLCVLNDNSMSHTVIIKFSH